MAMGHPLTMMIGCPSAIRRIVAVSPTSAFAFSGIAIQTAIIPVNVSKYVSCISSFIFLSSQLHPGRASAGCSHYLKRLSRNYHEI
jgi:hypothetical protein